MIRRSILVFLVLALVASIAAGFVVWRDYQRFEVTPLSAVTSTIIIPPGTSFQGVVSLLDAGGLVKKQWHWWLLGRLNPAARRLQAGEYRVAPSVTPPQLLDIMARGEVVQHGFTIIEGWRFRELRQALAANELLVQQIRDLPDDEVVVLVDPELDHPEGWFLPETYHFIRGTSDLELLRRAHRAMRRALHGVWADRREGLPLETPYEALILASIIEKETAVPAERGQIAGVFVRRLQKRMRLQTDPTVIYGLGDGFDGDLRRADLRRDNPYNTYMRHGLPPTPIALPGLDSLRAAVNPADGDTLYFVARGDGSHQFSATLEQHNEAVNRYQRGR